VLPIKNKTQKKEREQTTASISIYIYRISSDFRSEFALFLKIISNMYQSRTVLLLHRPRPRLLPFAALTLTPKIKLFQNILFLTDTIRYETERARKTHKRTSKANAKIIKQQINVLYNDFASPNS